MRERQQGNKFDGIGRLGDGFLSAVSERMKMGIGIDVKCAKRPLYLLVHTSMKSTLARHPRSFLKRGTVFWFRHVPIHKEDITAPSKVGQRGMTAPYKK